MAKQVVKVSRKPKKIVRKRSRRVGRQVSNTSNPTHGAVSTITTAPVAIGNSMSGFKSQVLHTAGGCRVIGRDYGFTPAATGSVTTWALTGGMPLTPACMPSTALRNFCQMYNKFKFNKCMFHYITSSSTSTTGDVLFQYNKNSESSVPNYTSASFLPYILSDSNTVIGPQWTNHSIVVTPTGPYRSTDYGVSVPTSNYSQGDIFLYSKTSSTESPGYVIFDYDISFNELSVNPRAGLLPLAAAQWTPVDFTAATTTSGNVAAPATNGTTFIGATTITALATSIGQIYKVTLDITNSTLGDVATAATLFKYNTPGTTASSALTTAFTLTDGFTVYCVINNTNTCEFYSTESQAFVGGSIQALVWGASNTTALGLRGYAKLIGSINPTVNQVQY